MKKNKNSSLPTWYVGSGGDTLVEAIAKETERGQALIACTFIENLLEECLRAKFCRESISPEFQNDKLLSDRGLFGSLWAKATACRVFGLIKVSEYEALEAVRKIRNAFAHSDLAIRMDNQEICGHVEVLKKYLEDCETRIRDEQGNNIALWRLALSEAGIAVGPIPSKHQIFLGAIISLYVFLMAERYVIETYVIEEKPLIFTGAL